MLIKKNRIYIIGKGKLAELVSNLLIYEKFIKKKEIFYVQKKAKNELNKKIISESRFLKLKEKKIAYLCLGDINVRKKLIKKFKKKNIIFPNFISNNSNIYIKNIGIGNFFLPNSVVLPTSKIKNFNIIGTSTNILHHVSISNNCIIGGGSTIGAGSTIGENVLIGIGSKIASANIKIENNVLVASGSVVLKSISKNSRVIGNPAKKIV
jgi:UDP-3-O-[3-hydroxymyristoyl] glucosamine N-acyltransferase